VGGTEDHIHALVGVPATASIADLVRLAKGASSHLANRVLFPDTGFRWQGSYAAFSVSRSDVDRVERYVRAQIAHHADGSLDVDHEL
jgi:REP element-mobilizing transposase RayT